VEPWSKTGFSIFDKPQKLQEIIKRYSNRRGLVNLDMVYYSERAITTERPDKRE
jgi:hypothetical protein